MLSEGYTLGIDTLDDIFQSSTSHSVFLNGSMSIIIHIPAYKINTKLRLLEYVPVPILISPSILQKSDHTGPIDDDQRPVAIFADPAHAFLAVTQDDSSFKTYTRSEVLACRELAGTRWCYNDNVYDKRTKSSCLYGLYKQDPYIISQSCVWRSSITEDFGIQLAPNMFILYTDQEVDVKMICDSDSGSRKINGLTTINVPAGCRLYSRSFIFDGEKNFSLTLDSFVQKHINMSEVFNLSSFSSSDLRKALEELRLVGKTTGITIPNLRARYDGLAYTNTWSWSTRICVTLAIILTLGLIIWHLIRSYKKRQRLAPLDSDRPFLHRLRRKPVQTQKVTYSRTPRPSSPTYVEVGPSSRQPDLRRPLGSLQPTTEPAQPYLEVGPGARPKESRRPQGSLRPTPETEYITLAKLAEGHHAPSGSPTDSAPRGNNNSPY
jgi:hypothetical protein